MIGVLRRMGEGKLLFIEKEGKILLQVLNANHHADDTYHLIAGWHCYKEPMNITVEWEADVINEKTCRLIKEYEPVRSKD